MDVVVAIDLFKGSISSLQAGEAIAQGIRSVFSSTRQIISRLHFVIMNKEKKEEIYEIEDYLCRSCADSAFISRLRKSEHRR